MIRDEYLGVTSIIRILQINPDYYVNLLHFFRSDAWSLENLRIAWIGVAKKYAPLYLENGMAIMIGDGVKESKEGRRTPGVKRLHHESENSGKSNYIHGRMFGLIGVLVGSIDRLFTLPLIGEIDDGVDLICNWRDGTIYEKASHVVKIVINTCAASRYLNKAFYYWMLII